MHQRHQAMGILCGFAILIGSGGCAINSDVALRAKQTPAETASPERLISIAKVFERQGRLKKADSMYHLVLQRDPSSEFARRRVDHIASLMETREFKAPTTPASRESDVRLVAKTGRESYQLERNETAAKQKPRTAMLLDSSGPQSSPDLPTPPSSEIATPGPVRPTAESLAAVAVESLKETLDSAAIARSEKASRQRVDPESHLRPADSANTLVSVTNPDLKPEPKPEPKPEQNPDQNSEPKRQLTVTVDRLEAQIESLLTTLRTSRNVQHRALAATLLAEAPTVDTRVNAALFEHCLSDEVFVAAAAADSLLVRDGANDASVQKLLELVDYSNVEIRNQVCCSLRQLAGTPWEAAAAGKLAARLNDPDPAVRSMAALTLGDFSGACDFVLEKLLHRVQVESDSGVKASLDLAASRVGALSGAGSATLRNRN